MEISVDTRHSFNSPDFEFCNMPKSRRRRSLQRQAIREIKKFQDKGKFATKQLIAKSCFRRLAREIAQDYKPGLRFREDALDGLQEAAETQIVKLLANANKVAVAEGRMTLQSKDVRIAKSIMEDSKINIPRRVVASAAAQRSAEDKEDEEEEEEEEEEEAYTDDDDEDDYVKVQPM